MNLGLQAFGMLFLALSISITGACGDKPDTPLQAATEMATSSRQPAEKADSGKGNAGWSDRLLSITPYLPQAERVGEPVAGVWRGHAFSEDVASGGENEAIRVRYASDTVHLVREVDPQTQKGQVESSPYRQTTDLFVILANGDIDRMTRDLIAVREAEGWSRHSNIELMGNETPILRWSRAQQVFYLMRTRGMLLCAVEDDAPSERGVRGTSFGAQQIIQFEQAYTKSQRK